MSSIPKGEWAIESIIVNRQTVVNNDGMRALQILDDEWVIQPAGQRFRIRQSTSKLSLIHI